MEVSGIKRVVNGGDYRIKKGNSSFKIGRCKCRVFVNRGEE